jgi:hypothetical protein
MRVAVGLEVSGPYLDRIDPRWLDGADFLGVCTNQPSDGAGWGEHMAALLARADKLRGGRDMGLVLHHPFRWRLIELLAEASSGLRDAGGFSPEDARVAASALGDTGAVAEVNFASYWHLCRDERMLSPARLAFAPLRDAGATFSLGSDFHRVTGLPVEYDPAAALAAFGLESGDVELPCPLGTPR